MIVGNCWVKKPGVSILLVAFSPRKPRESNSLWVGIPLRLLALRCSSVCTGAMQCGKTGCFNPTGRAELGHNGAI